MNYTAFLTVWAIAFFILGLAAANALLRDQPEGIGKPLSRIVVISFLLALICGSIAVGIQ